MNLSFLCRSVVRLLTWIFAWICGLLLWLVFDLNSVPKIVRHFLHFDFFAINKLNGLFFHLFLFFIGHYLFPDFVQLLPLDFLILLILEPSYNLFILLFQLSWLFQNLIHGLIFFLDEFCDVLKQLFQLFLVLPDCPLQVLRGFSFGNESLDELFEPDGSDTVLMLVLVLAGLILTWRTEERILFALTVKTHQTAFLLVLTLRVAECPGLVWFRGYRFLCRWVLVLWAWFALVRKFGFRHSSSWEWFSYDIRAVTICL